MSRLSSKKSPSPASPTGDGFLPGIAIDTVIFGFHDRQLRILILEYRNTGLFALPGGFITLKEDLDAAARRILADRTGLKDIWLEQFYVFGDYSRYDPVPMRKIMQQNNIESARHHWLLNRFISVGYYALVDFVKAVPTPDALSDVCGWYELDKLPALMQDHKQIVEKALNTLRQNLDRKLIGFNLLPETFTMGELQAVYETVSGESLNRSSFQRRMLALDILERIEKKFTGAANKAPFVYRFKRN